MKEAPAPREATAHSLGTAGAFILHMFRFRAIKDHLVEFNQLAIETADGSHDMINRVMTKDNIGLAVLLETTEAIWQSGM